jgi:8-oxo-dGTP pyrophosphatase MutT (NUDIX family)
MELVEVVDAHGDVEAVVSRAEMRARRLRHRCVAVTVLRPGDGAVLVHRRAGWKDVWPGRWDVAFGGVCGVGEAWEAAAVRELAEEAGIDVTPEVLEDAGEIAFEDDDVASVLHGYLLRHGGPFTFVDGEVEEVAWVPRGELVAWAAGRAVCPDTLALASATWLRR